jgi:Protein of unknown function (DUF3011)
LKRDGHFHLLFTPKSLDKHPVQGYPRLRTRNSQIQRLSSISKEGKMTRTTELLLIAAVALGTAAVVPKPAAAAPQPGYGPPPPARVTCSSNDGRRNWCDIGGQRDARLVRQISGSACIRDSTWGIDRRGLWVDRGCRAEFVVGRQGPPPPPPRQVVTCSSNDGRRNWCDIGGRRDVRLARQISGSACVRDSTWGVDRRGLWVDRGCRADFSVR